MSGVVSIEAALRHVMELAEERRATRQRDGVALSPPTQLAAADAHLARHDGGLGSKPRTSRKEQAEQAWGRWKTGGAELLASHVRTLAWDPEFVADPAFKGQLQAHGLSRRTLRALIPTYNRLWRPKRDPEPELARLLSDGLRAWQEPRGIAATWQLHPTELFGASASAALAKGVAARRGTASQRLQELELPRDTEFARDAASRVLALGVRGAGDPEVRDWLLASAFASDASICGPAGWGPALAGLILHPSIRDDERARERVLDLAMRDLKLGDPRIDHAPWTLVGTEATDEVIRWRSSEDLRFFFSLVMKGKADHQGRHKFWQSYVDGVTRSLIVLCDDDAIRLKRKLRDMEQRGRRFARMTGNSATSAFAMEFGKTVIVEFSEAGNACFVYQQSEKKQPIRWSSGSVSIGSLKMPRIAKERLIHHQGWERVFSSSLARLGIRPTAKVRRR